MAQRTQVAPALTGRVVNLATERLTRAVDRAVARAEAVMDAAEQEAAELRERLDDLGIDPRAASLLSFLRDHFAWSDRTVAEIDHLRTLLRGRPQ